MVHKRKGKKKMKIAQFNVSYNQSLGLWTICRNGVIVVSVATKEQAIRWVEKNADY
jgi:hypothetical protein